MEIANLTIIQVALDWLHEDQTVYFLTVTNTWGSSPRPIGAIAAISSDSGIAGSVSGGCVEDNLMDRIAQGEFAGISTAQIVYGVSTDDAHRFGLPCGGTLNILLERIEPSDQHKLLPLQTSLQNRQQIKRRVDLQNGDVQFITIDKPEILSLTDTQCINCFGPKWRILIIGAVEIAQFLAEFSEVLDFEVIICDPREKYWQNGRKKRFPINKKLPDDVVREFIVDDRCAVVTLSHDPRVDDMALMEALTSDAFYVGAMGSKKTTALRLKRLSQLDLSEQQIQRLHAPVGLDIGSKMPAEIAVSIVAELIKERKEFSSNN